jgi:hypothetical protein
MLTEAMTGSVNPTIVVTPTGNTTIFDGQFRLDVKRLAKRRGQLIDVEAISPPMSALQRQIAESYILQKLPEWERDAAIAGQCGTSLRVAIPDQDLVKFANLKLRHKSPNLSITEGKWGGTYSQVRADTVGGNVHHTPSNSATLESTAKGYGIWMRTADHAKTASHNTQRESNTYRDRQKRLIQQGQYDQVQFEDIEDIKAIGGELYDIPIRQMLKTKQRNQNNASTKRQN